MPTPTEGCTWVSINLPHPILKALDKLARRQLPKGLSRPNVAQLIARIVADHVGVPYEPPKFGAPRGKRKGGVK